MARGEFTIDRMYSAGLMSQSFWFVEMKKLVRLINEGKTEQEIKRLCIDDNLFAAAREYRAKRMYGYLRSRAARLDNKMIELFVSSDLATQKVINLIAILLGDRLFFEFVYEVYREKSILGAGSLTAADARIFFKNKENQSEVIASWAETTKSRLRSIYLSFLTDANLLTVVDKHKTITPPILDITLERYLISAGYSPIVRAITGVN